MTLSGCSEKDEEVYTILLMEGLDLIVYFLGHQNYEIKWFPEKEDDLGM